MTYCMWDYDVFYVRLWRILCEVMTDSMWGYDVFYVRLWRILCEIVTYSMWDCEIFYVRLCWIMILVNTNNVYITNHIFMDSYSELNNTQVVLSSNKPIRGALGFFLSFSTYPSPPPLSLSLSLSLSLFPLSYIIR